MFFTSNIAILYSLMCKLLGGIYNYNCIHFEIPKASSHDATCCMRLSFWRMTTTASAIISVYQLQTKYKI